METPNQDVSDITASILAIQAADNPQVIDDENIDMPCNHRGAAAGMDLSYLEIAKELGMEDNKFPESNVKDLFNRSLRKFIQHYSFMLISNAAMRHGFSEEDAIDFTATSYSNDHDLGKTDPEILRGWL